MKNRKININVFENIIIAVAIMLYFITINFAYFKLPEKALVLGLKATSGIVLALGIVFLEISYKKESGKLAINAIEILVLSGYTLSITHVVEAKKMIFSNYILISSYIFSLYYVLKAVIVLTKEKRESLKNFSDIKEIVNDEPIKKDAEKRS